MSGRHQMLLVKNYHQTPILEYKFCFDLYLHIYFVFLQRYYNYSWQKSTQFWHGTKIRYYKKYSQKTKQVHAQKVKGKKCVYIIVWDYFLLES